VLRRTFGQTTSMLDVFLPTFCRAAHTRPRRIESDFFPTANTSWFLAAAIRRYNMRRLLAQALASHVVTIEDTLHRGKIEYRVL
jgi:hypothetical protein